MGNAIVAAFSVDRGQTARPPALPKDIIEKRLSNGTIASSAAAFTKYLCWHEVVVTDVAKHAVPKNLLVVSVEIRLH